MSPSDPVTSPATSVGPPDAPDDRPRPTAAGERIELLDQLRGLAVCGILFVNMIFMAQPIVAALRDTVPLSGLDRAARAVISLFAQAKFISMFSLLFGAGLFILGERLERRGQPFRRVALRRYLALLFIGIAHGTLIWSGDILTTYALLAFVLLAFRRRQPRTLLIWIAAIGGLLLLAAVGLAIYATVAGGSPPTSADLARVSQRVAEETAGYSSGSFLDATAVRAKDFLLLLVVNLQTTPLILSMFLWGLFLARKGWLSDPEAHAARLRRLFTIALPIGAPAAIYHAVRSLEPRPPHLTAGQALDGLALVVSGMGLALAYTSGIALLSRSPRWKTRLAFLAPVGRMALTNYLAQSLLVTLIFNGYGLGLFGTISYAGGFLITIAVCALLVITSRWWFTRFRFGPVEWLWRAITYWTLPPMRRA